MNLRVLLQFLAIGAAVLPLIQKVVSASGLKEKVEAVLDMAAAVAAKTPTPLDDEVLAFVDKYGRDKAIDALVQVLELLGVGKSMPKAFTSAEAEQKAYAAIAEPVGIPVALLLKIAMIVRAAIELLGQFRTDGGDGKKPFPTPVFGEGKAKA